MTEFTSGIFNAGKSIYSNNKGSILRTIVYTIGHFIIAITVLMLIADVTFMIALITFYLLFFLRKRLIFLDKIF